MLSFLLDENLSPKLAAHIAGKSANTPITSVHFWREGAYKSQRDEDILMAASEEGLTLVTCDIKSIMPMLAKLGIAGTDHAGVIFIDDRTIHQNDFGAIVLSLITLWNDRCLESWTNRVHFLHPPP